MSEDNRSGSPPRVQRLPGALIDQIAAGEVVERPASAVKELVENAIDAGATRLRIEVRGGGIDWIAVTDDGCGMSPDDARLALERHATSKIQRAEDLERIATYGFRGEALPAIASVSKLRLRTRRAEGDTAYEVRVEAGLRVGEREVGAPVGTRVEVAELFGNVPARRKFLKTVTTEWGHVSDWVSRAALALPDVHFDVQRDDKPAGSWPAVANPLDRIAAVLSERDAEALVPVAFEEGRVRVEGFVSRPDRHRSNLSGVYLFVNRRPVRDRLLQHALVDCYRDVLPRGRFPAAVLFIDVPAQAVDVNVHPAKWEVRFADPRAAHRWVRGAVRGALEQRVWLDSSTPGASSPGGTDVGPLPASDRGAGGAFRPAAAATGAGTTDWIFAAPEAPEAPAGGSRVRFGELRRLGQLMATYLVLEGKDDLLLVDQHAAHERVLYEQLRADWLEHGVERQGLLAPLAVELEAVARTGLLERLAAALRLGFEIEPFGEDTLVVRGVPALLADRDPAALVRSLADELVEAPETALRGEGSDVRLLEAADRIFATLACHSARRKGDWLDPEEQRALLDALDAIPWAPTCPHGRPVCVPFERAEIERRFGRR